MSVGEAACPPGEADAEADNRVVCDGGRVAEVESCPEVGEVAARGEQREDSPGCEADPGDGARDRADAVAHRQTDEREGAEESECDQAADEQALPDAS